MQWDLFFTFQGEKIPDVKRVVLVASYMRGKAFQWIKPFVQQYQAGEAPEEVDEWMKDFDNFKEKIKPIFGVSNEPTIARRNIQRIRQEKSAADYAAEFQQLAASTDWDDTALMTMFKQGLKPKVKEELMRTGASTDTLDTLINTAIEIDVKIYELQQELRDDPRMRAITVKQPLPRNPWRNNLNRGQRGGRYQPNVGRRIHNNTQSGYYGPEAMDLSNLNKGPDRWNKKSRGSKPDKSSVTCYGCGKQGHFARDCRMKGKVVRQLNMLTTDDGDSGEEWEILTNEIGCLEMDEEPEQDPQDDKKERFRRSPTPYPEEVEEHLNTGSDGRYHAIEYSYKDDRVTLGKIHYGDFVKCGKKYFTPQGHELLVHDRHDKNDAINRQLAEEEARLQMQQKRDTDINYSPRHGMDQLQQQLTPPNSQPLEGDSDDEKYEDSFDTRDKEETRIKEQLACDEHELTGISRQLANAKFSRRNWADIEHRRWAQRNQATQTEFDRHNQHAPSRSEPDVCRKPARPTVHISEHVLDERNQRHHLVGWRYCYHNGCQHHYADKVNHQWFPSRTSIECSHEWYECQYIDCSDHLWDKRTNVHFPGITDPQEMLKMHLVLNAWCENQDWEICLNPACMKHEALKVAHGFAEDTPTEPFLGPRLRAPGIDLSTRLGTIDSLNYRSY